jgi:hypothetical protein
VVVLTRLVIPAQAGIQGFRLRQSVKADALDSRLRGNDAVGGGNDVIP